MPRSARFSTNTSATAASPPGHIHRTIANAPNLLRRFSGLALELRNRTKLDPRLRELALMTVGRIAGAEYEFVHHWNIALRVGVRREQLEQLAEFERAPVFNEQERAVMRYAAEVTTNIKVSDADLRRAARVSRQSAHHGARDERRVLQWGGADYRAARRRAGTRRAQELISPAKRLLDKPVFS